MFSPVPDGVARWLAAAAGWHAENADLRIPYHHETASGLKLGQWICRQRVLRRRGRLDPSVSSALDALDSTWHTPTSTRFAAEFAALARFREDHGHSQVPARYVTPDGLRLGEWLTRQRRLGRGGDLPIKRAEAFVALGVDFAVRMPRNLELAAYLAECRRWFQAHSHLRIPTSFRSNGMSVGKWLARQRFADRRGTIDARVASALDAIDATWPDLMAPGHRTAFAGKADRQKALLEAAKAFHQAIGHLQVPYGHVEAGLHLGAFMHRCRRGAASGSLDQDVIEALAKIDPHWIERTGVPIRYKPMLDAAAAFYATHQHLRVPKAYVTSAGTGLGWWLSDRRNQKRTGTLHADIGAALDAIDPEWAELQAAAAGRRSSYDASGLAAMREFVVKNGHAHVPVRYQTSTGFKLGGWLVRRRKDKRRAKLDTTLSDALSDLGLAWELSPKAVKDITSDKPKPDPAAKYVDAVYGFVEVEGHAKVPSDYVTSNGLRLGRWLVRQRVAHRNGSLRPGLKSELRGLGVDLDRRGRR